MMVPYGYGKKRVDVSQLDNYETWAKLHPEFKRRVLVMIVAANGHLGVGTGWRSSELQKSVFLERHVVSPGGKISWDGKQWALKPGMAPAAPPGRSFHEGLNNGMAMAIDVVGDIAWADAHADQFGLVQFESVNREPWHFQCAELPHGVTAWINQGRPQPRDLSGTSPKPTKPATPNPRPEPAPPGGKRPTLRLGDRGAEVAAMQGLLIKAGSMKDKPANHDGVFGKGTQGVVQQFQAGHQLAADGICGPRTWTALEG
jgi:hypothetical protein